MKVNVTGTFLVTRAMSAIMKSQEPIAVDLSSPGRGTTRGSIVNLGSASSFVATPKMIQYTAAKHAVLGITKNAGQYFSGLLLPLPTINFTGAGRIHY